MNHSRRSFLKSSLAAGAWAASHGMAHALAAGARLYPIGLQLFTVRAQLPRDYEGTLAKIAALGYQEVEAAGFFGHSAAEVKRVMARVGLRCVSAHYALPDLLKSEQQILDYAHTLGLQYVVCASPWSAHPGHLIHYPGGAWNGLQHAMTLDDWKWTAEQLQRLGGQFHRAGIQLAYHTHTMGFEKHGDTDGFAVLMHETTTEMVALELDCGWAVAAGQNPVALLHRYPRRIQMLHVKDMKPARPGTPPWEYVPTELGHGTIDYAPILQAARKTAVKHVFVEQDDLDMPVWEALKVDERYMARIDRA
jgi:sugar phosphate isomerase/epimerase